MGLEIQKPQKPPRGEQFLKKPRPKCWTGASKGPIWPKKVPKFAPKGTPRVKPSQIWASKMAQIWPAAGLGPNWPETKWDTPKLAQNGPKPSQNWPIWAKFGPNWPKTAQIWVNLAQIWAPPAKMDPFWPISAQKWPIWAIFGCGPISRQAISGAPCFHHTLNFVQVKLMPPPDFGQIVRKQVDRAKTPKKIAPIATF